MAALALAGFLLCASGIQTLASAKQSTFHREERAESQYDRLVWSDEFNDGKLDPEKWYAINKYPSIVDNNSDYQPDPGMPTTAYMADQVKVEDGCMKVLASEKETKLQYEKPFTHRAGRVQTRNQFALEYGKVEIRAKLPKTNGLWPAIWLLPEIDIAGVDEIDILEYRGQWFDEVLLTNHYINENGEHRGDQMRYQVKDGNGEFLDWSQDFHTYVLEWSPDKITWTIDGVLAHTSTVDLHDIPMYLIIETQIGGWGGDLDESSVFPQEFLIDYVRVYQGTDAPRAMIDALGNMDKLNDRSDKDMLDCRCEFPPRMYPGNLQFENSWLSVNEKYKDQQPSIIYDAEGVKEIHTSFYTQSKLPYQEYPPEIYVSYGDLEKWEAVAVQSSGPKRLQMLWGKENNFVQPAGSPHPGWDNEIQVNSVSYFATGLPADIKYIRIQFPVTGENYDKVFLEKVVLLTTGANRGN